MWIIEWFHAGAAECYCITRNARDLSKWKFQQAGFSGWNLFSTGCAGSTNCVSVFVPNGRGVFRLYQAGGRSAERGRLPRPRLGQRGRDTCGFPSSLNSYLSLGDSTAKIGEAGPLRNRGMAVGLPLRVFLRLFAVHRQRTATQTVVSRLWRVAHMCSSTVSELRIGKRKGRTRSRSVLMRGKILCRSPISKRSPVSGLRQTKK